MVDEGFNTTKTFSKGDDLELFEEAFSILEATFNVEGKHSTGSLTLALGQGIVGVGFKSGV